MIMRLLPELKSLCESARESPDMLVALGAQIALSEFVAGRTTTRLHAACETLEAWLRDANSLVFRMRSWREMRESQPDTEMLSFVTDKAVRNRSKFYSALKQLSAASDGTTYTQQLRAIVAELRHPCLRLTILQQVLGLDESFSRDIVFGVVCLAHDIVDEMSHASLPSRGAPSDFVAVDEAIRLEADEVYGVRRRRCSDPLGAERRKYRVIYNGR